MPPTSIPPEKALHDLTLAVIYLSRNLDNNPYNKKMEIKSYWSWKNYDWDVLDQLNSEELITDKHGNKTVYLTDEGIDRAREILKQFGIEDWEE